MTRPEENPKIRPITARIVFKALLGVALTAALLWLWESSIVRISKNFEEVDPGKFYRSAQLTPKELKEVIQKYGIKTVISLRGAPEKSYWAPKEIETLAQSGVAFHHFSWATEYFPTTSELKGYLSALKSSEFPVLVHCRTGADQTGEAAAMYAIDYLKLPREEAIDQHLTLKNYHVRLFHPAKTEFVKRYPGMEQALATYNHCSPEYADRVQPNRCP